MDEKALRSLLDAVPFPIMVVGLRRIIVAANGPMQALFGDHVIGRHFTVALRQPLLVSAVEAVLDDQSPRRSVFSMQSGDSDLRYDVTIRPQEGSVVLTFEDRTAAESVNRFRRDFVANVSHELRTPLTALFGFIETLRGPARDDPAARDRFLGIMESEASRMIQLVDDLLSLSRVEEEERVRPSELVALGDMLRSARSELEPVIKAAGASVDIADDSGGQLIPGDPRQLRQVIGNLIENAVKYGRPEGHIQITLTAPDYEAKLKSQAITLSVQDDGPGIPSHHIPRLTERFYRVDEHRSREIGGTGLGLAIVKHIVNRHRGRMVITSDPGQGTCVSVILLSGSAPA